MEWIVHSVRSSRETLARVRMEALALAALLGLGYVMTTNTNSERSKSSSNSKPKESFLSGGAPAPAPAPPIPGNPRKPSQEPDNSYDQMYQVPARTPYEPVNEMLFATSMPFSGAPRISMIQETGIEGAGAGAGAGGSGIGSETVNFVSPLSGLAMDTSEFTHANMVPFFRGSMTQNTSDDANRARLDNMIGTGFNQIEKREQAPLFDPVKEPMGNITGLESMTDFMQDRVVASTNRAFERPVEPTHVGPGINQGYSSLPIGGFQQLDILEIGRDRLSVDALRTVSNPKLTYEGVLNPGKALNPVRGEIGEVRHYNPDRFFLNENGERNFVGPVADNLKPTIRSSNVMKFQARQETSVENFAGPAVSADFSATYTTPSFRAPHTHQQDGYGFRNADGSIYGVANTDAPNNDYGASSVELPVNQRNVTSERGQGLNVTGLAAAPQALTVHDPSDVWRTTIRETTGANDWIGTATGVEAKKLTVYDPSDIPRATLRNTNAEVDTAMNVTLAGMPGQRTLAIPDGARATSKEMISANSAYTGSAGSANAKGEQVYDTAYAMRQNGVKELTAVGRKPIKGNGVKPLFNGEDYVNMTNRKLMTDVLNDRDNTVNRVVGPTTGTESVGLQRPKQTLSMDISRDRNNGREVLGMLESNPYVQSIHRIAQGQGQGQQGYSQPF